MVATNIQIPTFDWNAFYYGEMYEALIQFKRIYASELTDESEFETTIQVLKAFACVGHLNNVLADLVANESTLPTAKLAESVRNMLRLIDYEMQSAAPSQTDMVFELTTPSSATIEIVPNESQVATRRTNTEEPIYFEVLKALSAQRTDQHGYVLAEDAGVFTDYTAKANSAVTPGDDWTPWATEAESKDAIYWGHPQAMWDKISVPALSTDGSTFSGVFEYYDGDWHKIAPTSVTDLGATLRFDVNSLLGYTNRKGTKVRVYLNVTGAYEALESTWTGSANVIETVGLLGQSIPSTDAEDYTVGSDWTILDVDDGTGNFTSSGDITYTLPQTELAAWVLGTIDSKTAFWIRYRVITTGLGPISPVFQNTRMDTGKLYVSSLVTQGRTFNEALGSSNGEPDQRFPMSKDYLIWGSETITIESEDWVRVDNFLNSQPSNKHYMVTLDEDDRGVVIFGSGNAGKIPSIGVNNIGATYRYDANLDGNAGANTITVDKSGLAWVNRLWNPRQASGWNEAEGATVESLERVKISGPATLRTKNVAISPDDLISMTLQYKDTNGASPYVRAFAFEEGFGPKTVELVVVTAGGGLATTQQLADLQLYFNGDKYTNPPLPKRFVSNQEVVAVNYVPKPIDVTATVYGSVTESAVINGLNRLFQPNVYKADGVTFEWRFGDTIGVSRINHEIFDLDDDITKVTISVPVTDVVSQPRELPTPGTFNITVAAS